MCEVNRGGSRGGAQGHDGHDGRGLVSSLGKRVASRSGDGLLLGGAGILVGGLRGGGSGRRSGSLGLAGHHVSGVIACVGAVSRVACAGVATLVSSVADAVLIAVGGGADARCLNVAASLGSIVVLIVTAVSACADVGLAAQLLGERLDVCRGALRQPAVRGAVFAVRRSNVRRASP